MYKIIAFSLIKLFLIYLIFLFLKLRIIKKHNDFHSLFDVAIKKGVEYLSVLIILLAITIQLGFYDGIIVSALFLMYLFFDHHKTINLVFLFNKIKKQTKVTLIQVIENLEKYNSFINTKELRKNKFFSKKNSILLLSVMLLILLVIFSSFYYLKFDHYLFSSTWFETLKMVNAKNEQHFFTEMVYPEGQYAFINYLSRITNASTEITIYAYSIFQLVLLVIIMYWFVFKITRSQIIVPLTVGVFFLLGFSFLPVSINSFFQSSAIHFSFIIVLPIFYYFINPKVLKFSSKTLFIWFAVLFSAIALISVYTFVCVFPLFFLLTCVFLKKQNVKERMLILSAYVAVFLVSFIGYYVLIIMMEESFFTFLRRNIIDIDLFFFNPYLNENIDELLFKYQVFFLIGFLFNRIIAIFYRIRWKKRSMLFLYGFSIYTLTQIHLKWVDVDILYIIMLLFLPIQFGILISIILDFFKIAFKKRVYLNSRVIIVFFGLLSFFGFTQTKYLLIEKDRNDLLNEELLLANEMILKNYLDRSYMVTNKSSLSRLSSGNRFFAEYSYFLSEKYMRRDSLFAKYKNDRVYLSNHPETVVPSSMIVFVYKNESDSHSYSKEEIMTRINELKKKGRRVRKIYFSDFFEVYEIINKSKASKVSEMVF